MNEQQFGRSDSKRRCLSQQPGGGMGRRRFLRLAAMAGATPCFLGNRTAVAQTGAAKTKAGKAESSGPESSLLKGKVVLNPWRLQAVDLRRFMRLGVEHIGQGAVDRRRGCLPLVRFYLTEKPARAAHEYWSSPHMVGRFLDALAVTAEVVDAPIDDELINGLRTLLHASLDNPTGLPFYAFPSPEGKRTADMHNCRETLLGLVALGQWRHCERSMTLARSLVRTIDEATRATGGFPSPSRDLDGWAAFDPNQSNTTTGLLIGGLLAYYRATNDPLAIDLAKRFAEVNLRDFTPDGELAATAGTHLHSTEGTITAILDLGVVTGERRYIDAARRVYDVGLKQWRTSYGWAKEQRNTEPGRGEANNTGDFIEAALILGQNGQPQYYRDAERFIRNGLLASQIVATDWIGQSDERDADERIYSDIRRRARGAFAFTTPNGYHSYNTDLIGGALQSLAQAYRQIVSHDSAGAHVNMLFTCDSPWLTVKSSLPEAGRLDIRMLKAEPLWVRMGDMAGRGDVEVRVNGVLRTAEWAGSELVVRSTTPDATVSITFPLDKRHTTEPAPGHEPAEIDWLGDTIVGMQPSQGVVTLY